jgi:hypothetical protein
MKMNMDEVIEKGSKQKQSSFNGLWRTFLTSALFVAFFPWSLIYLVIFQGLPKELLVDHVITEIKRKK